LEVSARHERELCKEEEVFKFRVEVVLRGKLVQEVKVMSMCGWDSRIQTMSGGMGNGIVWFANTVSQIYI